eukprot:gene9839-2162_t
MRNQCWVLNETFDWFIIIMLKIQSTEEEGRTKVQKLRVKVEFLPEILHQILLFLPEFQYKDFKATSKFFHKIFYESPVSLLFKYHIENTFERTSLMNLLGEIEGSELVRENWRKNQDLVHFITGDIQNIMELDLPNFSMETKSEIKRLFDIDFKIGKCNFESIEYPSKDITTASVSMYGEVFVFEGSYAHSSNVTVFWNCFWKKIGERQAKSIASFGYDHFGEIDFTMELSDILDKIEFKWKSWDFMNFLNILACVLVGIDTISYLKINYPDQIE